MVGFFECVGIDGDLDGEGLDGGEVSVDWKVVAAAGATGAVASLVLVFLVVAEGSLRSRRRRTACAIESMVVQIIIGQSEFDHRLRRRLTVLGDVHADFILMSDFGWDPSPLGGVGPEPNVGTHLHVLKFLGTANDLKAISSSDEAILYLVRLRFRCVVTCNGRL